MSLESIDQGALHGIHNQASFPWLTPVMVLLFYLGSRYVITAGTLLAAVVLAVRGRRRSALFLLITVAAAFGLGYATQFVVNRPLFNARWSPVRQQDAMSFPSQNALTSAALFGSLALMLARPLPPGVQRRWVLRVGVLPPFLTGVACLWVGHNYPSDVVGGWLAGAGLAQGCAWADEAFALTPRSA
jgi:undecaprenyl-diphosphatase